MNRLKENSKGMDIKMKDKLYFLFYRKLGSPKIAILLSDIVHTILVSGYHIIKFFINKKVTIAYKEAYQRIETAYKRQKSSDSITDIEIDNRMDLSIIIPVYNVEQFLEECLQSAFSQETTYQYEIIAVNDGSTDHSKDILLQYTDRENYRMIDQENGGLSNARNTGIRCARGKHYFFLDSDDVITSNCVQTMLDTLYYCQADVVQCRYYSFQEGNLAKYFSKELAGIYYGMEIPVEEYPGFAWGKVYKASLFQGVRFPEGFWFEDTIVQYMLLGKCNRFVCTEEVCYGYRKNPNSISFAAKNSLKCLDTYWITKYIVDKALEDDRINKDYIYKLTLRQYSTIMHNRLHWIQTDLLEAAFAVVCEDLHQLKPEGLELKGIYKEIEKSFETKNINLWKLCSLVL